ncbi:hypothetical protein [Rhizobium sp. BK060]|uniref:hypothetical protein n=1 Tax=Rhizobium sp. BK060 TaxID=2587096 RepID=UPI0016125F43|nr:hypothetical protein [Rhizobium sp. BK060]MBB3396879.1 hypothetical protein [Rhizobium sp. BK060]
MTVPIWPESLPQYFTTTSYDEEGADNVLRSETSVGPAKTRRRTTANVWKQSGQMVMSAAQFRTFLSFVENDILDGAKAFSFPAQLLGANNLVRMTSSYKASRVGAQWYVSLALEVLP